MTGSLSRLKSALDPSLPNRVGANKDCITLHQGRYCTLIVRFTLPYLTFLVHQLAQRRGRNVPPGSEASFRIDKYCCNRHVGLFKEPLAEKVCIYSNIEAHSTYSYNMRLPVTWGRMNVYWLFTRGEDVPK